MPISVLYRAAEASDMNRIRKDWKRSARDTVWDTNIAEADYYRGHGTIVDRLIGRCVTLLACDPAVRDHILAWACYEVAPDPRVHYCYVAHPFRRLGIARELLRVALPGFGTTITRCSHVGRGFDAYASAAQLVYDPYTMF